MKEILRQNIIKRLGKLPSQLEEVLDCFRENEVSRKTPVLLAGEVCQQCYFITHGSFKIVRTTEAGEDHTLGLIFDEEWFTALDSFRNNTPATESIIASEDTQFLSLSKERFTYLSREVTDFNTVYRQMLEESQADLLDRVNNLMALDALARLKYFQKKYPQALARINAREIASHLDMTPETLSRLRTKI
ncbi:Crp/Fnr family transcriptional regulator [Croceiramulus getboli]|nr:cyclic nucleotide-binding domain-containing protein [Flavobacteriaceae bacterium YJPT1-3]